MLAPPASQNVEGSPAPLFTVQAVKSHKPSSDTPGYETLLSFKRKQIITVLDWDEERDAVYGEYDGKKGWFPSSFGKILPASSSKGSVAVPVIAISGDISTAAAMRNSIPVDSGNGENNIQAKGGSHRRSRSGSNLPTTVSSPNLSPRESLASPRRLGILSSSIQTILPKSKSGEFVESVAGAVILKNVKHLSNLGVPMLIVNIVEYCRASKGKYFH